MGGDIAPAVDGGGALPKGAEETGRREKSDAEPPSRAGRSASEEPSMAEMDMLLPGRWWCAAPLALGGSRDKNDVAALPD